MKRIFLLALSIVLIVLVATVFSSCGDDATDTTTTGIIEEDKESLSFALNADGISYRVTGIGTYKESGVEIPVTYNSLPVTAIADRAL